jgi:hypothetical protein
MVLAMSTGPDATYPTRQVIAAKGRSGKGVVTGRLKRALDEMVWSGARRADAAIAAGMTDHSLRSALKKPHVKAYYLTELGSLRESTRAKIHHRLEALSEQDENKAAAVKACQVLIADDPIYDNRRAGMVQMPGLVIQIVNDLPAPRERVAIDITPPRQREPLDAPESRGEPIFRAPWDEP